MISEYYIKNFCNEKMYIPRGFDRTLPLIEFLGKGYMLDNNEYAIKPIKKSHKELIKEYNDRYKVVFGTDKKGKDTTVLINKDTNEKTIVKRNDLEERDYEKAIMYALLKEQGITCDIIDSLIEKGKNEFQTRKNIKKKKQEKKCKKTFESILNEAKGE